MDKIHRRANTIYFIKLGKGREPLFLKGTGPFLGSIKLMF